MELLIEEEIVCPHCGEAFPLLIDTSLAQQTLVEDCSICCSPIQLQIEAQPGEITALDVRV